MVMQKKARCSCCYEHNRFFWNLKVANEKESVGSGIYFNSQIQRTSIYYCLVPRPISVFHLGQSVSDHVVRSSRMCHQNEFSVRAWEKAMQGLGNIYCSCKFH